ncbi:hypothetical protein [Geothrix sp. 21YS21S-2]|uniref:hypothetical protein n=1 Tax=Geothrix sp. 21YS21S-2 TaxID=3068893 RepID=UPI0027B9195F|nr:hypothetical protein [Geothrix sp. 21YS21S-2]
MKRTIRPYVPVLLSEMELHWLITQHDRIIGDASSALQGAAKAWNEERRGALLSAWDKSRSAVPRTRPLES